MELATDDTTTLYYRTCNNWQVREEDIDKDFQARCLVNVNGNCVIVTELPKNPGMSVTNAAEYVADEVCARFGIHPEELVLIEHYPEQPDHEEMFALVDFANQQPESENPLRFKPWNGRESIRFGKPHWKHLTKAQALELFSDC